MSWHYVGSVPASKSMLNRALIIASYSTGIEVVGRSEADDVRRMKLGLEALENGGPIDCGDAGTTLRFLALRAARNPGRYELTGSERLFSRPQKELARVLLQLGCQVEWQERGLFVRSWGWKVSGDALHVSTQESSQFLSSVVLNSWNLDFPLFILVQGQPVSLDYFAMTVKMVERQGMKVERWGRDLRIAQRQSPIPGRIEIEPDLSSAFTLAAAAAVAGSADLKPFPKESLQPDAEFVAHLKTMGVGVRAMADGEGLQFERAPRLKPISVDLKRTPDLFPVLAALAALSEGWSSLRGAPQLAAKESHRIKKTSELLRLIEREVRVFDDGIEVLGYRDSSLTRQVDFDPDQDHRMAMAAAILKMAGEPIRILNPKVVDKSFPGLWQALGVTP